MAEKEYNYLDEYKKSVAKNKKNKKPPKRKKIWGLKGLASFASKYKPKTSKRA
tara:strand:- start:404 stop:562 length:159 start_codon:yes stop_codon:yes gene_type:complete